MSLSPDAALSPAIPEVELQIWEEELVHAETLAAAGHILEGYRNLDAALAVVESQCAASPCLEPWAGALSALYRATLIFYAQVHEVREAPLFSTSVTTLQRGFIPL